jgi:gamma-glutamyltranspeptidase/glutathione hydrolase
MLASLVAVTAMTAFSDDLPKPPPEAGAYPEPVEVPHYLPKATLTKNAMVSAAHPLAAKVGADILRQGGNAIDATVAVQMVLNVVEPQSSGIGGGCFILYYDAKTRQTHCLDGREETPSQARRADFLDANGKVLDDELTGGLPVGVPGTVAAMWQAHQKWGKLSWARVLEPAIRLASDGIGVTPRLRISIAANRSRFLKLPSSKAVFLHEDGSLPETGEVLKQPDLARTLRLIAAHGPKVFYEGEVAQDIVKAVQTSPYRPGRLTLDDLRNYRAVPREPIRFPYRGWEIVSMPPPSSGGITLGLYLGILEDSDIAKTKPGTLDEIELLARAGAGSFADRNAYLGDQDWCPEINMCGLLNQEYVRERARVSLQTSAGARHQPGTAASPPHPGPLPQGGEGIWGRRVW